MLLNIRSALATAKTTTAGPLNARRRFRPFGGSGFDSLSIDIVADAMDHTPPVAHCERLSIALRMIVRFVCGGEVDAQSAAFEMPSPMSLTLAHPPLLGGAEADT